MAKTKRAAASTRKASAVVSEKRPKLFVSFWHISLLNFPTGNFRKRRITTLAAKRLIQQARKTDGFMGVSDDDLFAPHRKREQEKHQELCDVLTKDLGIPMAQSDFASAWDDDPLYCINPLVFANVEGTGRLLVVTCCYVLAETRKKKDFPAFRIDPATVEFHLFEAAAKR